MCNFFVRKFCPTLFGAYKLGLNFLGARILAQMRSWNVGEIDHRCCLSSVRNKTPKLQFDLAIRDFWLFADFQTELKRLFDRANSELKFRF